MQAGITMQLVHGGAQARGIAECWRPEPGGYAHFIHSATRMHSLFSDPRVPTLIPNPPGMH